MISVVFLFFFSICLFSFGSGTELCGRLEGKQRGMSKCDNEQIHFIKLSKNENLGKIRKGEFQQYDNREIGTLAIIN